jgi:hypothetical protein
LESPPEPDYDLHSALYPELGLKQAHFLARDRDLPHAVNTIPPCVYPVTEQSAPTAICRFRKIRLTHTHTFDYQRWPTISKPASEPRSSTICSMHTSPTFLISLPATTVPTCGRSFRTPARLSTEWRYHLSLATHRTALRLGLADAVPRRGSTHWGHFRPPPPRIYCILGQHPISDIYM